MKNLIIAISLPALALFAGCGDGDQGTQQQEAPPKQLTMPYVEWSDAVASTNVMQVLLEDRLGFKVDAKPVTAAFMWSAVATGGADAMVAAWLPTTHEDYFEDYKDQVVDLGPNFKGARVGLVVPAYVTIDSVDQINENAGKFNSQIIGIEPGSGIMRKTENALEEYNMTDIQLVSSSGAAMASQLGNRIDENEWIVVTGWTPHWMFHRWDLKYLEDPKNVYGASETINTIVRQGLEEDFPDAYTLLNNFRWTEQDINQLMAWNQEEGADPQETARRWVNEHPDLVNSWLPQEYRD